MLNRRFLILSAACVLVLPGITRAQEVKNHMQLCATNADCTIVTSSCGNHCEAMPINRSQIPAFQSLAGNLCSIGEQGLTSTCNVGPQMTAACIGGTCTVGTAWEQHADSEDYIRFSHAMSEEMRFSVPKDDRDGRFTAYDLPHEVVREGSLGQLHSTTNY